jgi:hypothetical protein
MSESICKVNKYGSRFWYNEEGKFHRIDGPAVEWSNGIKFWFINGVKYSKEEFNEITEYEQFKQELGEIFKI